MKASVCFLAVWLFLPWIVVAQVGKADSLQRRQILPVQNQHVSYAKDSSHAEKAINEMVTPTIRVQRQASTSTQASHTAQLIQVAIKEGGTWYITDQGDTVIESPRRKIIIPHHK